MRALLAAAVAMSIAAGLPLAGCGSRCAQVTDRKHALLSVPAAAAPAGAQIQVQVPLARANAFLAELLDAQPLVASVDRMPELVLTLRGLKLLPAAPGRLRFEVHLEIDQVHEHEPDAPPTLLKALAFQLEVQPKLERTADGHTELVAILDEAGRIGGKELIMEHLGEQLGGLVLGHLGGLEKHLLATLGAHTPLRLRLPDVPIASFAITSTADDLTLELATDLPARGTLAANAPLSPAALAVRVSTGTATALANWSIDHGRAPQRYTRELKPRADGEFRPYFFYDPAAPRPLKVFVFQEHGGCSYIGVGMRLQLAIENGELVTRVLDRYIEEIVASAPLEIAVWLDQLVRGAVDSTKRTLAEAELSIGEHHYTTRLLSASAEHDELAFTLEARPR